MKKSNRKKIREIIENMGLMEFLIEVEVICYDKYRETDSALWKDAAGRILEANLPEFVKLV